MSVPAFHGDPTFTRLEQMLSYHEGCVASLRTSLALLIKGNGNGTSAAPALEAPVRRKKKKRKPRAVAVAAETQTRRQATAALLATFDSQTPGASTNPGIAVLVRHGYLKKAGDGWVRTRKVFRP